MKVKNHSNETMRCLKCDNCLHVASVQAQALKALSQAQIKQQSIGEDVRLIWNRTLEEYPCTGKGNNNELSNEKLSSGR
jgi:hypothetical protein